MGRPQMEGVAVPDDPARQGGGGERHIQGSLADGKWQHRRIAAEMLAGPTLWVWCWDGLPLPSREG
jgi:hypothetical protein